MALPEHKTNQNRTKSSIESKPLLIYIKIESAIPHITHTHSSLKKMENSLPSSKLVLLLAIAFTLFLNTELSVLAAAARALDNTNSKVCNASYKKTF